MTKSNTHPASRSKNHSKGDVAYVDTSSFSAAYERRLPEILAIAPDELVRLNIDIYAVVSAVLGVVPKIQPLVEEMKALDDLDLDLINGLEDYAEAAGEANARYLTAASSGDAIVVLNDQAMEVRDTLRADAEVLASHGLIDGSRLKGFTSVTGYRNVGFDLIEYANVLGDAYGAIAGKTALTAAEIQSAKELGEKLVRAAAQREQETTAVGQAALIRQQALTLLTQAYDETRRAVVFLRWHLRDADTIAPSLYAGRGGHARAHTAPAPDPVSPTPAPAPEPPAPATSATNRRGSLLN